MDRRKPRRPLTPCKTCDQVHERDGLPTCSGHRSNGSGEPCRRYPTKGTTKCLKHGSASPQVKAKVKRQQTETAIRETIERLGGRRDISGAEAITEQVQEAAWNIDYFRRLVESLGLDPTDIEPVGEHGSRTVAHIYVKLYGEERERLVRFAQAEVSLGIQARRVELAEEYGRRIVAVLRGVLGDLDLSEPQRQLLPGLVRKHMEAVTATAVEVA